MLNSVEVVQICGKHSQVAAFELKSHIVAINDYWQWRSVAN